MGYNRFGGKKKKKYGYQSKYFFDAFEGGSFFLFNFSNLRFGGGIKFNHHISVKLQHITSTESYNENRTEWFTKWSLDAGVRMTYLFSQIYISFEAWFGLNDLRNSKIILPGGTIRENHYRFMIGYSL